MSLQVEVTVDREINKPRPTGTWYRPDGKAIPGLPVDGYHMKLYGAKGWSLTPPVVVANAMEHPTPEPYLVQGIQLPESTSPTWHEVTATEAPAEAIPPVHIHVFALPQTGAPCLVAGCHAERKVTQKTKGAR